MLNSPHGTVERGRSKPLLVTIEIRYFARCRELAGIDRESYQFSETVTLADVRAEIRVRHPDLLPYLKATRLALNQEFTTDDTPVNDGDDIALIPPVSGGVGLEPQLVLSHEKIGQDAAALLMASSDAQGALATFVGIVRRESQGKIVRYLDYEAFEEMAIAKLKEISNEATQRWPLLQIAVVHRVGRVVVGEVAVSIAVSSSRRAAAFDGCRHMIERIKEDVPIWKKEVAEDGSHWWGGAG
jgi:molybdopterin converting factor subunit 1